MHRHLTYCLYQPYFLTVRQENSQTHCQHIIRKAQSNMKIKRRTECFIGRNEEMMLFSLNFNVKCLHFICYLQNLQDYFRLFYEYVKWILYVKSCSFYHSFSFFLIKCWPKFYLALIRTGFFLHWFYDFVFFFKTLSYHVPDAVDFSYRLHVLR